MEFLHVWMNEDASECTICAVEDGKLVNKTITYPQRAFLHIVEIDRTRDKKSNGRWTYHVTIGNKYNPRQSVVFDTEVDNPMQIFFYLATQYAAKFGFPTKIVFSANLSARRKVAKIITALETYGIMNHNVTARRNRGFRHGCVWSFSENTKLEAGTGLPAWLRPMLKKNAQEQAAPPAWLCPIPRSNTQEPDITGIRHTAFTHFFQRLLQLPIQQNEQMNSSVNKS